jgi:hypothetical protein
VKNRCCESLNARENDVCESTASKLEAEEREEEEEEEEEEIEAEEEEIDAVRDAEFCVDDICDVCDC